MRTGVADLAPLLGVVAACQAVGLPRSTYYRRRRPTTRSDALPEALSDASVCPPLPAPPAPVQLPAAPLSARAPCHPRALSEDERAQVRTVLNSERFADCAPRTVYATLLSEQEYLCSWRTMYRILAEADEVRERRNQVRRTSYAAAELLATAAP
jgi:putative transposase